MPIGKRESRVQRRIERYRLLGMGADLESRWTHTHADDEPHTALEALTTYFNTAIVRAVFARVGDEPPDYTAEDVYRLLTADDPPAADETTVRTWLDDHGVDPDALTADFVSPRAIHRYLRAERDVEIPVLLEHPPEAAQRHDVTAADLDARIREADDPRQADRLRFIHHLYDGKNVPEAAAAVGYNPSTGYRWLRAWEEGGLDGLLTDGAAGWRKLTARQEHQFVSHLATADRWATDDIHEFLAAAFDVTYSDRHLRRKLEAYGLEKMPHVDAYRWPPEAPEEPATRRRAALEEDERERSAGATDEGRDATG